MEKNWNIYKLEETKEHILQTIQPMTGRSVGLSQLQLANGEWLLWPDWEQGVPKASQLL